MRARNPQFPSVYSMSVAPVRGCAESSILDVSLMAVVPILSIVLNLHV